MKWYDIDIIMNLEIDMNYYC